MKEKDSYEEYIYNNIANIEVDNSNIKNRVINELKSKKDKKNKSLFVSGLAMAMSLFLVVGVSASILNNSEWFMDKFNPTFKEIVNPIDIYSEDHDIKLELIAGQKYDNNAIVYLSLQDTSGNNRITENTEFKDGLFVGINNVENSSGGYGVEDKMISFDEETNTIYYELNISTDVNSPLSENLRLGTSKIYFDSIKYEDELIKIGSKDLENSKSFHIEESKIWAGRDLTNYGENLLEIGKYSEMPHGNNEQWISNIGLIDGRLHIQVASNFNKDFGPSGAYFSIKDEDGELIGYEDSIIFLTDKDGQILDIDKNEFNLAEYKYKEFIFPIVENRELYEIYYTGSISNGVTGSWEVETDLSGDDKNIRIIDRKFNIGNYEFEKISLNPLGLKISGRYNESKFNGNFNIEIDTKDGFIDLDNTGVSVNSENAKFDIDYKAAKPILIDEVEAIIIDGFKLDLK